MDCQEARESILESLVKSIELENHLAACDDCASFFEFHRVLDARLAAVFPTVHLSPGFRTSLRQRLRRDAESAWPDFLPDLAHLAGCAVAIVLSILLLPWKPQTVALAGTAFACVTYFLQAVLRSSLEELARD